jgi:DNA-binding XRE family transcriptional regulator
MSEKLRLKLKAARAKLGLTQKQAAKKWGIELKTLVNWEQNRNTPSDLALEALNKKLDRILKD